MALSRAVDPLAHLKIEKNKPIPERTYERPTKYPVRELQVGDSFFVPCGPDEQTGVRSTITSAARRLDYKVVLRKMVEAVDGEGDQSVNVEGIRVWRVE